MYYNDDKRKKVVFEIGKTKSYLYGFVIGGVAAGLTTLLYTPKSGETMRRDLKTKVTEAGDSVTELKMAATRLKDNVTDLTQKGIPAIKSTVTDVRAIIDSWQQDIQPNLESLQDDVKHVDKQQKRIALKSKKPKPSSE